jgi:hypothetical protein
VFFAIGAGEFSAVGAGVSFAVGAGVSFAVGAGVSFAVGTGVFAVGAGVSFAVGAGVLSSLLHCEYHWLCLTHLRPSAQQPDAMWQSPHSTMVAAQAAAGGAEVGPGFFAVGTGVFFVVVAGVGCGVCSSVVGPPETPRRRAALAKSPFNVAVLIASQLPE